jgi:hypothetical protein
MSTITDWDTGVFLESNAIKLLDTERSLWPLAHPDYGELTTETRSGKINTNIYL